jgi:hypothetical protein
MITNQFYCLIFLMFMIFLVLTFIAAKVYSMHKWMMNMRKDGKDGN